MKNDITELVFILDRSGSMAGLEGDTIGGFNAMIEKQKRLGGRAFVSTVLFDSECRRIHDRLPILEVPPLTDKDYFVGGCTALMDAVGGEVEHISKVHRYIRAEDVPEKTIFVITTDGMENASRKYKADEVRKLVEKKREEGWEFIFLAANIDAAETAESFGVEREMAVNYHADGSGTKAVFESVCAAVSSVRERRALGKAWAKSVSEDNERRK